MLVFMYLFKLITKISCIILTIPCFVFGSSDQAIQQQISDEGIPILNALEEKDLLPGNFRMTRVLRTPQTEKLNLEGLGELNASGSAQFSECGLNAILKKLGKERITLVNLRQEDGGFLEPESGVGACSFSYLMAMPWWTGEDPRGNRSVEEIEAAEESKMSEITKQKKMTLYNVADSYAPKDNHQILYKVDMVVKRALTEKQLASEKKLGYIRIPDKKFGNMEFEHVDAFVKFVSELPPEEWVHFHCKKGCSRTTLFMVMYDMMRNAEKATCEEIIQRQGPLGLGGADLAKLPPPEKWDHSFKSNWLDFLSHFHRYVLENKGTDFAKPFSTWAQEQGIVPYPKVVLGHFYKETTADSHIPEDQKITYNENTLVINSMNEGKQSLSNFRTTQDLWLDETWKFNDKGLSNFNASGSSQYSKEALKLFINKLKPLYKKIVVVDLRHDDHLFVNGLNISTFETKDALLKPRTPESIIASEEKLKAKLSTEKALKLKAIDTKYPKDKFDTRLSITLKPELIETPQELVTSLGAEYLLIGSKRFSDASDEDLDRFISFMRYTPKETWIHFHCKKGKSRTTFFLAIYDMMCNADKLSFEKILERQKMIGGSDLLDVTAKDPAWPQEKESKKQWIRFLSRFHTYCVQQKKHGFSKSWSQWSIEHRNLVPEIDHLVIDKTA